MKFPQITPHSKILIPIHYGDKSHTYTVIPRANTIKTIQRPTPKNTVAISKEHSSERKVRRETEE